MKTNLIDEMATALLMALDTMYDGKTPKTCKIVQQALTRYEAEKDNYTTKVSGNELLLEKTQEWHDHGAVAPSCVGCPTAEVVIADGKYTRVITENLEKMADKLSVVKADLDQIEWAKLFMSDHWIITWAEALKIDVQIGLDAYREGSDNGTDRI